MPLNRAEALAVNTLLGWILDHRAPDGREHPAVWADDARQAAEQLAGAAWGALHGGVTPDEVTASWSRAVSRKAARSA